MSLGQPCATKSAYDHANWAAKDNVLENSVGLWYHCLRYQRQAPDDDITVVETFEERLITFPIRGMCMDKHAVIEE